MKIFRLLLMTFATLTVGTLSSCIQKEPLNTECDIETASLPERDLVSPVNIDQHDNVVTFVVKNYVNLEALAPDFVVTPGATIDPPSGTVRDFTDPQIYTVTSEDGQWKKEYTVIAQHDKPIELKYSFENIRTVNANSQGGTYDEFVELSGADVSMAWASGNQGFAMTNGSKGPDTYPTFQTVDGYVGKCAELVTRSTGTFGSMVGLPLAAGNLFIGVFNLENGVGKPLEATRFGTTFYQVPIGLRGYYKYTPGETYKELVNKKLVEVPGKTDECNIYAVFFERTPATETAPAVEYLNGTNVLSDDNPNIIAVARLDETQRKGASDWTYFDLEFIYRPGKKDIDPDKLESGAYAITVVMSSSIDGDRFSGAVGSTLLVDEVELVCL